MAIQLIGAGLGRTGTTSLKTALEQLLGGRCYHMGEVANNPDHPDLWAAAYRGDLPDWDALLDGYVACVDWPSAPFWADLADAYPDAPILLSTRDPDAWWRSASTTIFKAMEKAYFGPDADDNGWTHMCVAMMQRFTPDWRDEDAAKAAFVAYNDEVRRHAPPERLVEWQPHDGWEPICAALGVGVPDEPFPHVNTREEIQKLLDIEPD
jgi:hypothetical protein